MLFLFVNFGNSYFRSSSPEMFCKSSSEVFCKEDVLQNFAKFTGNTCARASFLIKLQASLLKKRLWHMCFSVNFAKYLRTHFVIEQLRWLRLTSQLTFTCSKSTIEPLEKGVKYVQS